MDSSRADPGFALVEKCFNYCARYHPGTQVMAAGIRSKEDALQLAGCDFLVLDGRILKQLSQAATAEGYNDGLRATGPGGARTALSKARAAQTEFDAAELEPLASETQFDARLGPCGRDLLASSLKLYSADVSELEPYFTKLASSNQ